MLTIEMAMEKLMATVVPRAISEVPLKQALGLTLAADIFSSSDSPPFDKSMMDGYAVKSSDIASGTATLRVIETVTAGRIPSKAVGHNEATQIMTGATIPDGADAVVKVEETERRGDQVIISTNSFAAGTNVIRRGASVKSGDRVLRAGMTLNASRIGAMAELGQALAPVRIRPTVAILATGDELVPFTETPGPGQIRNSNESMLAAQVQAAGGVPVPFGIARDNLDDLRLKISRGLECDLLLLSGGVSAGTLDLVPATLAELGVTEVFHKVEMKPGKPIWFGVKSSGANAVQAGESAFRYVFGLPGNPVSSLVCCELFVRPSINRIMGIEPAIPQPHFAALEHPHSTRKDRPTYHPARLTWTADGLMVTLVAWHGSSDLCGTVAANGMAYLSGEALQLRVGDRVECYFW